MKWPVGIVFVVSAILLSSCEAVFTFSPLKAFATDPSKMSPAQQVAYAETALSSGNIDAMTSAYNAIKSSTDPSTQLLAGELAFTISGATNVMTQALGVVASGGSLSSIQTELQSINTSLVSDGAQDVVAADNAGVPVSDTQYALAAASLAASAAKQAGGYSNLSSLTSGQPGYTDYQLAKTLSAKITSPDLSSAIQDLM